MLTNRILNHNKQRNVSPSIIYMYDILKYKKYQEILQCKNTLFKLNSIPAVQISNF